MNPNRGEGPSNSEQHAGANQELEPDEASGAGEQLATHAESSPSKQPPALTQQAASDDAQALAASSSDITVHSNDQTTQKVTQAHDTDRIEHHWVESAKQIINQTKDDPYKQKNAMSKVKSEYIKYRFNKVVKADTEVL